MATAEDTEVDQGTQDQDTEDQGSSSPFQPAGNSVIHWQDSAPADDSEQPAQPEEPEEPEQPRQFQPAGKSVIRWQQPPQPPQEPQQQQPADQAEAQPPSQLAQMFPSIYGTQPAEQPAEERPPKAQPVPGGPVPRARPAAQQSSGLYDFENPEDFVTGTATMFGDQGDIDRYHAAKAQGASDSEAFQVGDNGIGSPALGGLPTTDLYGAAVPAWVLRSRLGNSPAAWRKARLDIVDPSTGTRLRVPIVDIGPSASQEEKGIVADFTPGVDKYFNNQGGGKNLMFRLVKNAGPDVNSDTPDWNNEQAAIASGVDVGQTAKAAQTYPAKTKGGRGAAAPTTVPWTVNWITDEEVAEARRQTQQDKLQALPDEMAALNNLQQQNPNPAAMMKALQQPIKGVSDDTRQDFASKLKAEVTQEAQKFYKEPDPDKAYAKATSQAGPLELGSDFWHKIIAGAQEYQLPMAQMGPYGTAKNDINSFFGKAGITSDADKHAFLTKLYAMPYDEREKAITDALPPTIPGVTPDLGPSTNPAYLARAVDKLADPKFEQQQNQEIARVKEQVSKNLETDPRLKGTMAGDASSMIGQSVADLATMASPALWPMFAAKISNQIHDQVKQEHPDWTEDKVQQTATYGTLVATLGQVGAGHIFGAVAEPLLNWIEKPVLRALAKIGIGGAGGAALGGGGQAAVNIATGQPVGQGVAQAAVTTGMMGLGGAIMHGPGEYVPRETKPVEVTPPPPRLEVPPPVVQPTRPVTAEDILGTEPGKEIDPPKVQDVLTTVAHDVFPDLNDTEARQLADRVAFLSSQNLDVQRYRYELQKFLPEGVPLKLGPMNRLLLAYYKFRDGPTELTAKEIISAEKAYNQARQPGLVAPGSLKLPVMWREAQAGDIESGLSEPDWQRQGVYLQEQAFQPAETLPPLRDPSQPAVKPVPATAPVPQTEAPITAGSTGLENLGEMGKGISAAMRDMLWEKFQRGDTTEAGGPSSLLLAAAREKAAGRIKTRADFEALIDAYGRHLAGIKASTPPVETPAPEPIREAPQPQFGAGLPIPQIAKGGLSALWQGIKNLGQYTLSQAENIPQARALASGVKQFWSDTERDTGVVQNLAKLHERLLSKNPDLDNEIDRIGRYAEANNGALPSGISSQARDWIRYANQGKYRENAQTARNLGVKVRMPDGSTRPFIGAGQQVEMPVPRIERPDVTKILQGPMEVDPSGTHFTDSLVDKLYQEGRNTIDPNTGQPIFQKPEDLLAWQTQWIGNKNNNPHLSGIEMGRALKYPSFFYTYSPQAMLQRLAGEGQGLARIKNFGQRLPGGRDQFDQVKEAISNDNTISQEERTRRVGVIDQLQQDIYGTGKQMGKVGRAAKGITSVAYAAKPSTAAKIAMGMTANVGLKYGPLKTIAALAKTIFKDIPSHYGYLRDLGLKSQPRFDLHRDPYAPESRWDQQVSGLVGWAMKWSGHTFGQDFGRALTARGALADLENVYMPALAKDPTGRTAVGRMSAEEIERRGLNPADFANPNVSQELKNDYIRRTVMDLQTSYYKSMYPALINNHPFLAQFGHWGYTAATAVFRETLNPMARAFARGDLSVGARYLTRGLIGGALAAIAGSEGVTLMKQLFGNQDKESTWGEIWNAFQKQSPMAAKMVADRLVSDIIGAPIFGTIGDVAQAVAGLGKGDLNTTHVYNPAQPAVLSVIGTFLNAYNTWAQQHFEPFSRKQWGQFFVQAMGGGISDISKLQAHFFPENNIYGPSYKGYDYRNFARRSAQLYLQYTGQEKPQRGGNFPASPNTPYLQDLEDKLYAGDAEGAKAVIKRMGDEQKKTFKELLPSIRSSVNAHAPLGNLNKDTRADFWDKAPQFLDENGIKRIQWVDDLYKRTAAQIGINVESPSRSNRRQQGLQQAVSRARAAAQLQAH